MRESILGSPLLKSRALLIENLTEDQRKQFAATESFTVVVNNEEYELKKDITIRKRDGARLCAVVPDNLPAYDQMLARKLALENDPESFFTVANNLSAAPYRRFSERRIDGLTRIFLDRARDLFRSVGFNVDGLRISIHQVPEFYGQLRFDVTYFDLRVSRIMDIEHLSFQNANITLDSYLQEALADLSRRAISGYYPRRLPHD